MEIKDSLKDVLQYDEEGGCIRRIPNSPLLTQSKRQEFSHILIENEEEGAEAWDGYGYCDDGDDGGLNGYEDEYCICTQKITCLYFIRNIKSGNIYQVGIDCVSKHISEEIAKYLKKERDISIKKKREEREEREEKEELDNYISKCQAILEWAKKNKSFNTKFVTSVLVYCKLKNTISKKQQQSIDKIISSYNVSYK